MPTTLVSTAELAAHSEWRVFDCRHDLAKPSLGEEQYREAHIRGALFAHLDRDLSAPKNGMNGRHPLPTPEACATSVTPASLITAPSSIASPRMTRKEPGPRR